IQFHQMTMNNISQISSGNLSNGQVVISDVLESKAHSGELIENNIVAEYFKQGNILLDQGRYEEANNYYNEALKINKDLAEIRYQNARCYALRGSTNLAIGNLEWAIDINAKYKDTAENDPAFDSIKFNEHFKQVLNEVRH
ncbi:MAG TPA: tetratricopeptide repeat protein, partial [Allocoleopsis sp.]